MQQFFLNKIKETHDILDNFPIKKKIKDKICIEYVMGLIFH